MGRTRGKDWSSTYANQDQVGTGTAGDELGTGNLFHPDRLELPLLDGLRHWSELPADMLSDAE